MVLALRISRTSRTYNSSSLISRETPWDFAVQRPLSYTTTKAWSKAATSTGQSSTCQPSPGDQPTVLPSGTCSPGSAGGQQGRERGLPFSMGRRASSPRCQSTSLSSCLTSSSTTYSGNYESGFGLLDSHEGIMDVWHNEKRPVLLRCFLAGIWSRILKREAHIGNCSGRCARLSSCRAVVCGQVRAC